MQSPRAPQPVSPPAPRRGHPGEDSRGGYGGGGGGGGALLLDLAPPLPDRPPFKVYLGNIPYDLDEEVVARFFQGLEVGRAGGTCDLRRS